MNRVIERQDRCRWRIALEKKRVDDGRPLTVNGVIERQFRCRGLLRALDRKRVNDGGFLLVNRMTEGKNGGCEVIALDGQRVDDRTFLAMNVGIKWQIRLVSLCSKRVDNGRFLLVNGMVERERRLRGTRCALLEHLGRKMHTG